MACEVRVVPILVQEIVPVLYTKRSNDEIDCLTNGYTQFAQMSKVGRRLYRRSSIEHARDFETLHGTLEKNGVLLVPSALQHFEHDKVPHQYISVLRSTSEELGLW